jgi:Poly-beta-hydroxybutyrate polymerase N terminal
MLARLTGGISPVVLLLAYTDWFSHLAASPQRQVEISQEAVQDAKRFFESVQHFFKPDQGPWSLIKPQSQDRRFARPDWEKIAVQPARASFSAGRARVAHRLKRLTMRHLGLALVNSKELLLF